MKHDSTITILNQKRIIPDCQNGVIIASQKTMHVPIIHTNKYQEKSRQKCYLSPHGGIGDQIICNGLVRFLHKTKFREIHLEINKNNEKNVKRMYKDCKWIRFFYSDLIGDSNEFRTNNSDILFLKIRCDRSIPRALERFFYKCVDVPFEERWNSWFVERNEIDRAREKKIMNYLGLKENYIFISDKWSGGVTNLRISNNLQQIKPYNMKYEETIFDWIGVLEKAKEIHCANTSFFHLINCLIQLEKLYF